MKLLYCYVAFMDRDGSPKPFRGMSELELNFPPRMCIIMTDRPTFCAVLQEKHPCQIISGPMEAQEQISITSMSLQV